MAEALVERRPPPARFFCHRCNIEFEDVLQDYICPYCAGGFIEQLENEEQGSALSGDDTSDADMGALDDSDDMQHDSAHPIVNDLAFLMSGGRLRGVLGGAETLLQQFVWALAGGHNSGAAAAGAPFVLVGAPGDYVLGGEGLDAVVTQLLGQLEGAGPPPLPRERIDAIPSVNVSDDQAAARAQCSVCWELFQKGESVSQLSCEHVFHAACIQPWLQLHATCPICRRCLLPEGEAEEEADPAAAPAVSTDQSSAASSIPSLPELLLRGRRNFRSQQPVWNRNPAQDSTTPSSSSSSTQSSVTVSGVWAQQNNSSSTSLNSSEQSDTQRQPSSYNMDMDFD